MVRGLSCPLFPVLFPPGFKNRSSPHLKQTVNEAEWRRQLFSIPLYSHPSVGVAGLIYCLTPVLKTEQTCIIPAKLLVCISRCFGRWGPASSGSSCGWACSREQHFGIAEPWPHLSQAMAFTTWSNSTRKVRLVREVSASFFHQASADSSSAQVSSALELRVCSGRARTLFSDPVDFHTCSSPLENLSTLHVSHCWGLSEWAAGGGGSSTYCLFSEALWITVGMLWNLGMMLQELGSCGWSNSATKLCCPYSLKMSLGASLALCSLCNEFRLGWP